MLSSALSRFNANLGNDAASTTKSTPQKALFGITPVTFVGRRECIAASDDDGAECAVAINSITKSGRKKQQHRCGFRKRTLLTVDEGNDRITMYPSLGRTEPKPISLRLSNVRHACWIEKKLALFVTEAKFGVVYVFEPCTSSTKADSSWEMLHWLYTFVLTSSLTNKVTVCDPGMQSEHTDVKVDLTPDELDDETDDAAGGGDTGAGESIFAELTQMIDTSFNAKQGEAPSPSPSILGIPVAQGDLDSTQLVLPQVFADDSKCLAHANGNIWSSSGKRSAADIDAGSARESLISEYSQRVVAAEARAAAAECKVLTSALENEVLKRQLAEVRTGVSSLASEISTALLELLDSGGIVPGRGHAGAIISLARRSRTYAQGGMVVATAATDGVTAETSQGRDFWAESAPSTPSLRPPKTKTESRVLHHSSATSSPNPQERATSASAIKPTNTPDKFFAAGAATIGNDGAFSPLITGFTATNAAVPQSEQRRQPHSPPHGGGTERIVNIVFEKSANGLGFSVAGGSDVPVAPGDEGIYVTAVIPGGAAFNDGRLLVGDCILEANFQSLDGITHDAATAILRSVDKSLSIVVSRLDFPSQFERQLEVRLQLSDKPPGLGLGVAGGRDAPVAPGDTGIYVTTLAAGGEAEKEGRLRIGDRIIAANGRPLATLTHEEVIRILAGEGHDNCGVAELALIVARPAGPTPSPGMSAIENSALNNGSIALGHSTLVEELVSIEFPKVNGGLGFSIAGGKDHPVQPGDESIYVTHVLPGGAAALDGRLMVGDRLVEVNGISIAGSLHGDVVAALKLPGDIVSMAVSRLPAEEEVTIEVSLEIGDSGLGICISGGADPAEDCSPAQALQTMHRPVVLSSLRAGGAAAKDGRLKVGDRIVAVDGRLLDATTTHAEAVEMFSAASALIGQRIELRVTRTLQQLDCMEVFVDVAFRFPSDHSAGLGISVAGGTDSPLQPGDDGIYITQLVVGGAAHADGRLRFGDRLISINGISMEHTPQSAVSAALEADLSGVNCRVARLPLAKDDAEDVLQVEFPVPVGYGLGLGIAGGTDERVTADDVSIYITAVKDEGAAALDGRLLVGDKILVCNGTGLAAVTHDEAIAALRSDPARSNLTISRLPAMMKACK